LLSNAMSLPNFLLPWTHSFLVHVFINFSFKCFKCEGYLPLLITKLLR
jgi:hypothetical protein